MIVFVQFFFFFFFVHNFCMLGYIYWCYSVQCSSSKFMIETYVLATEIWESTNLEHSSNVRKLWHVVELATNCPCYQTKKKNKCYVSKLVIDWKTWPKCVFFLCNIFFFFFLSSRHVRFESVTALKYELDFWMNKIQDRTQSWTSLLFKVLHCVCHIFSFMFDKQVHKKTEKKN